MKRKAVIAAILTFAGLTGYFLWAYSSVGEGFDPDNDFANWQPTADVVRRALPSGSVGERQQAFALLFQKRFRKHEPGKAIGVHFNSSGTIRLLTPARLEPWNIDRIALMLYREAQQDFARNYDIDIYETYIGAPPLKIGELRPSPTIPQQVNVHYKYRVGEAIPLQASNRNGKVRVNILTGLPFLKPQRPPSSTGFMTIHGSPGGTYSGTAKPSL